MNYLEELERAIAFIENNLHEDIKAEEAAGSAGYSYYHFHRVFEAVLGETVGNYIRSRRLARVAHDLLYTDKRILDIALSYQFGSQEALSRAFKKTYKTSPGNYRKNGIDAIVGNQKALSRIHLRHLKERVTLQPRMVELEERMLVGTIGKTTLNNNRILDMWKSFSPRIPEIRDRKEGIRSYGICETEPDFDLCSFDKDTETRHFLGVEVSTFKDIPEGMCSKVLRGGKYMVFTHKGKISALSLTYDYIWGTWVLCSGYEIDNRDDFEYYDERFLGPDEESSEMDIYIPVK